MLSRARSLLDAIAKRDRRAEIASLVTAAIVVAALVSLLLATGVAHDTRFGHDTAIYLDAGWRVASGQRPHVDFHTPLGLVTPLVFGAAMRLGGADATALGLGAALFVIATSAWAWLVARGRLAPWVGAAFVIVVACTGAGQYVLSFDYVETSHASVFNRFAYAVLCILLVEALVPASALSRRARALGGFSSGAALAVLFFVKPSFPVQAVPLLAMGALMGPRERARWIGLAAGVVVATVALLAIARTSPGAVLADYVAGMSARESAVASHENVTIFLEMTRRDSFSMTPAKLLAILLNDVWSFSAVFALAALVPAPLEGVAARAASRRAIFVGVGAALLASIPIVFTNWQWGEEPSTVALGIVLFELAARAPAEGAPEAPPLRAAAVLALGLFVALPFVARNVGSVLAAWSWHETITPQLPADMRFDAAPLRPAVVMRSDGACQPTQYAKRIDDGTKLLLDRAAATGTRAEDTRIVVFDFSNPFSFALHAPPARGTELWWHLGATFNETHAPRPDEVLGDADVVLIPKCAEEPPTRDALLRLYGPTLDATFDKDAETATWVLLRKKR